jgi:hypothetical protein
MKHDQYSPGYHLPVYSPEKIRTVSPDYIVVLSWQHQNSIIEKHKLTHQDQWIFFTPPATGHLIMISFKTGIYKNFIYLRFQVGKSSKIQDPRASNFDGNAPIGVN